MLTLDRTEEALKTLCMRCPELTREVITPDALSRQLQQMDTQGLEELMFLHAISDTLEEQKFISKGMDIGITRHKRYLPALTHVHHYIEMVYVRSGTCENRISGEPVALQEGDICVMAPGKPHAIFAFSDDAVVYNIMVRSSTFDTAFFGLLSDQDVLSRFFMQCLYQRQGSAFLVFRTAGDPTVHTALGYLYEESQHDDVYKSRMLNNLFEFVIIQLLRHHETDVIYPRSQAMGSDADLMRILNYIQQNYASLTLESLSDAFGYSTRHMARLVKECSGLNLSELIRTLKLKRAAALLDNPQATLTDIMTLSGFSDASNFYRLFKREYGMTPADYRKRDKSAVWIGEETVSSLAISDE